MKKLAVCGVILALLANNSIVTGIIAICILGPLALRLVITAGYLDKHHYRSKNPSEFD